MATIHDAQMLTYMSVAGLKKGLLMNFNSVRLKDGIKSFVLGAPEQQRTSELQHEEPE